MWNRIFLGVMGLSLALMAFLTFYSWSWLQSIGNPKAAADGYAYFSAFAWPALWLTSTVLLVLGTAVLWVSGRAWAMWTAFLYFAILIAMRFFWLERSYAAFLAENRMAETSISFGPLVAAMVIIVVAAIVFFAQFLVLRMRSRMYPTPELGALEDHSHPGEENESETVH